MVITIEKTNGIVECLFYNDNSPVPVHKHVISIVGDVHEQLLNIINSYEHLNKFVDATIIDNTDG